MKKFSIFTLLVSLLLPFAAQASFIDVESNHPYRDAIEWLQQKNISPLDKTKFSPDKRITKGELYELAWRAAGYIPSEITKVDSPFSDLDGGSRFAPYAKKAVDTGLIKGGGTFRPGTKMSRVETLKTLFSIMGIGITRVYSKQDLPFRDVKANSRFAPYAKTALEFGIMDGEDTFRANQKISRGEVADYIYRISTLTPIPTQTIQIIEINSGNGINNDFTNNEKFRILMDVWDKIHEKYVGKEPIDDKKLVYGAINGMVNRLGDKYTVFQEPVSAKTFSESLTGEFDGIGVSIDAIEGKIKVVSPLQGTPASRAGLKPNDIILEVDRKEVTGLTLTEVSSLIKGPTGTKVELVIEREGKKITFSITREHIRLEAVSGEMRGNVAYIQIRNFTEASGTDFTQIIKKLLAKNPTSFVIDLRDNPGGYLDASLQMLDTLLPKKTRLASIKFSKKENAENFYQGTQGTTGRAELDPIDPEVIFYSLGNSQLVTTPIKVLINGGSASASEIMAAALRENDKATIIGEKSFGKGTVQEITDYVDGSLYKQTIGRWQTPRENNLTEHPINPDIIMKDDPKTKVDEVLEYALKN